MTLKEVVLLLACLFVFAAQKLEAQVEFIYLEHSLLPVSDIGKPGCFVYRSFLNEVDDPRNSGQKTFKIDTTRSESEMVGQLQDDCPPATPPAPQSVCPYESLTSYAVPAWPGEANQHSNMDPTTGLCAPNHVCGVINISDGSPRMSCVPVDQDPGQETCNYPKVIKNGVCQYEECPGGCPDVNGKKQKCSLRVLTGTPPDIANCPDCTPVGDEALWFCEDANNVDPTEGVIIDYNPSDHTPKVPKTCTKSTTGVVSCNGIITAPICPPECTKGCVSSSDTPTRAGQVGLKKYCKPDPEKPVKQACTLVGSGGQKMTDPECNRNFVQPDPNKATCPAECKTPPCMVTHGPGSFGGYPNPGAPGTDEQGCKCPPPQYKFISVGGGGGSSGPHPGKVIVPGTTKGSKCEEWYKELNRRRTMAGVPSPAPKP